MRKITRKIATAFINKRPASGNNTTTDGERYLLHGNVIAKWQEEEVWITDAGWNTVTTRDRLKGIGANVYTSKGQLYLNGKPWNGEWTKLENPGL
jgi:hypothetical protein